MKSIKFSHDYPKLPISWEGTEAVLIGVYPESVENLKNKYGYFLAYDTKFHDNDVLGDYSYYTLNFKDALILIFIHLDSGIPFTTIRRNYTSKFEYYMNSIGETFILERARNK